MIRTILVIDHERESALFNGHETVTFEQYLEGSEGLRDSGIRVVNLCDTDRYLSRGYYCSLLAEARRQKVIPDVNTINDLRESKGKISPSFAWEIPAECEPPGSEPLGEPHLVYFGWTESPIWQKLAAQVFNQFTAPLLRFTVTQTKSGPRLAVARVGFSQLKDAERQVCLEQLDRFTHGAWRASRKSRSSRWDMAILVNPAETHPPSDRGAIKRFIKSAARLGIKAELVTASQASQIGFYDALFIRETTAIDHHTYRLARKAEQQGLVVIDDPQSILRCCNKVYLHDAFASEGVPTLKTRAISSANEAVVNSLENEFGYPLVLKTPEGSFSRGVFRIKNREELTQKLQELLKETALVLVQEYFYTEFDWRIGVLNGRAIYACRYNMVRNHWQIYNHTGKRSISGGFSTLPTFEAPRPVLDAAIKASRVVGDGLYGVDLKQGDKRVAVIEVNDNPSLDRGVEDLYLGRELYDLIMSEFVTRLERRGR